MGMLSNSQPQQHRAATTTFTDSPPELVSPSSSTYSSVSSEGYSTWRSRSNGPLSPPMSSHDQAHPSVADDMSRRSPMEGQEQKEATGQLPPSTDNAARPQLPSLSSLFPPGQRNLPSPLSERPPYSATSPLDPPRSAGGYLERSAGSSYFSAAGPSATTHQARSALFDRGAPASHSRGAFPGPLSPALREPNRTRPADPSNRWSFHQDMIRGGEYAFGGRDRPARYQTQPMAGQKHDHEGYLSSGYRPDAPATSSQQHYQAPPPPHHGPYHHAQQPPTTPATTGETIPTKDGLGPKIWTGSHFLPRFVRAAELPGEGLCYFYDDGSHCKTVIDGEAVNAHWGVTKAGKPRKRLAIACVTCREKKIKCDPDYPRCVQCEKFGRICKFKNAPRGGGHHNLSPSTPLDEREESPQRQRALFDYSLRHSLSISPRTAEPSLALAAAPKRVKYEGDYQLGGPGDRRDYGHHAPPPPPPPPSTPWQQQQQQQHRQRPVGQLPLPRLDEAIFRQQRWLPEPYSPEPRHGHQEMASRRPDARV